MVISWICRFVCQMHCNMPTSLSLLTFGTSPKHFWHLYLICCRPLFFSPKLWGTIPVAQNWLQVSSPGIQSWARDCTHINNISLLFCSLGSACSWLIFSMLFQFLLVHVSHILWLFWWIIFLVRLRLELIYWQRSHEGREGRYHLMRHLPQ